MDYISCDEMYQAYIDCRKKKKNKISAKKFEENALYNIQKLTQEINNRKYIIRPSQCFIVKYPTTREVFCANFRDRVVQHFVYNELNPYMDKSFIYDTANCRKNKGVDFAISRVSRFAKASTLNGTVNSYYLKMDLSGFFMSMNRKLLLNKLNNFIDNEYKGRHKEILKYLVEKIILNDCTINANRISPLSDWDNLPSNKTLFGNPNGLPIGNICSQLFANFYLNDLDHAIKSQARYYSRYVDDMIIIDNDPKILYIILNKVEEYLPSINLILSKKKTRINKVKYGIDYLGVKIYPTYNIIGKSRINRTYYAGRLLSDPYDAFPRIACRWGMFKRYHGWNIIRRWYNNLDSVIKQNIITDDKVGFRMINKEYFEHNKKLHKIWEGNPYGRRRFNTHHC